MKMYLLYQLRSVTVAFLRCHTVSSALVVRGTAHEPAGRKSRPQTMFSECSLSACFRNEYSLYRMKNRRLCLKEKKADALFILGMVFVPASLLPAGACLDTMRNWFRARVNEGHFLVTQQSSPFSLLGRSLFQEFSLFRFFFLLFVRLAK